MAHVSARGFLSNEFAHEIALKLRGQYEDENFLELVRKGIIVEEKEPKCRKSMMAQ